MAPPAVRSVLETLPKQRLVEVARHFGVGLSTASTREQHIALLDTSGQLRLHQLVEWMGRDELRRACEQHGLSVDTRARPVLAAKLLEASGAAESVRPMGLFGAVRSDPHAPRPGDIVHVRQRQYLVEAVTPPPEPDQATLVDLVCLDDDNQGRSLRVLWELELGAQVKQPEVEGLGTIGKLDPPRHFAAYLHALRWNTVTATDTRLFQSPFRAGIKIQNHQLIPLKKALELPRANLFIADDVGLGKTIEAGLVLQELELRQRVDFVLIVCPASICLQWRREMEKRFGQRFEIYDRELLMERRRQRGFGVQAWATHNRFIISYQTLRRPEYIEPLIQHLGSRLKKSLLVLDEAHTAAPASASKYAIDSRITAVARDLAPRFENRLFLSATPHNGHSNSFSALMEILDPQRFTRGVPINATSGALNAVMVRRLKRDLRNADIGASFPLRHVVPVVLDKGARPELRLAELLAEYTKLMRPKKGRGQLVFINLQKRLLSSVEAFYRTLQVHAERVEAGAIGKEAELDLRETLPASPSKSKTPALATDSNEDALGRETSSLSPSESETAARSDDTEAVYDADEDALDRETDRAVRGATQSLQSPSARARELLAEMLSLAKRLSHEPDAKVLALIDWIQKHQCSAVAPGGAQGTGKALAWQPKRVLIFTEYADTKRYLTEVLGASIEGTDLAEERIEGFHGAMSDEQRESVQRHFNGDPAQYPVRILIATDAAREGLNLQNYCADLFHFDIPWNPARMEQRNGRIDRTLQPSPEVRCHYFVYPDRPEDAVLKKLVEKVGTIANELGSLGDVVLQRLGRTLDKGIDSGSLQDLDRVDAAPSAKAAVQAELEAQRADIAKLKAETDEAAGILNASRKVIDFKAEHLRDAINVGLELAGNAPLRAIQVEDIRDQTVYELPPLGESWAGTLDSLRPPRERNEEPWEWRKRPPQPVVFHPLDRMGEERVHLHLEHPFVQRILARFRSQGYSAHDLSRVTVVPNPDDALVRVIAFGRVSLFGPGAARLHDEIISLGAQWLESKGKGHLRPFADEADRRAVETLERLFEDPTRLAPIPESIQQRLRTNAAADFLTLWEAIKDEAEARAHRATQKLAERGRAEAEALRQIITAQRDLIRKTLKGQQLALGESLSPEEKKQWENDKAHMAARLTAIDQELASEPAEVEALYQVSLKRLEPIGLVYLWPTTRL